MFRDGASQTCLKGFVLLSKNSDVERQYIQDYVRWVISIHSCTLRTKMEAFQRKRSAKITSESRLQFDISVHTSQIPAWWSIRGTHCPLSGKVVAVNMSSQAVRAGYQLTSRISHSREIPSSKYPFITTSKLWTGPGTFRYPMLPSAG